ncbi:hypothetical protein Tco_0589558, partial [Tanacetum coccineum]
MFVSVDSIKSFLLTSSIPADYVPAGSSSSIPADSIKSFLLTSSIPADYVPAGSS